MRKAMDSYPSEELQDFYRGLAADTDAEARKTAANKLAAGTGDELARNLPILHNMLSVGDTRLPAAVSLLICKQHDVQSVILELLASDKLATLEELGRVEDPAQLAFARKQLETIAREPHGPGYEASGYYDAPDLAGKLLKTMGEK